MHQKLEIHFPKTISQDELHYIAHKLDESEELIISLEKSTGVKTLKEDPLPMSGHGELLQVLEIIFKSKATLGLVVGIFSTIQLSIKYKMIRMGYAVDGGKGKPKVKKIKPVKNDGSDPERIVNELNG